MNSRYEFWCDGCIVYWFDNLNDALAELKSCKRMSINAYVKDTQTEKEYR